MKRTLPYAGIIQQVHSVYDGLAVLSARFRKLPHVFNCDQCITYQVKIQWYSVNISLFPSQLEAVIVHPLSHSDS